ncbi:MAG: PTS transporter subunit EIIC [Lachnospiraceae bacterium]|nr:PTS transporter subunit EIIC [Lachnospiraceae bacterium]
MMEKFQAAMEKTLIPVANKLSANKVLRAISSGFSALLPIIMVGAIASLLSGLNIEAYQNLITSIGLKTVVSYVSTYTTNMIALYAVFSIARAMADQLECKAHSILVGLIALFLFLLSIPTGVGSGDTAVSAAISTSYFGSAGLFTAMLIGIIVPYIYNIFVKKNIVIKMPDGVPPQIANGFSAIIPTACLTVIFVVIRQLCALTSFETLNGLIYGILKAPLSNLSQSPITFLVLLLLCNLLWFFGIHGGMVTMSFLSMLYLQPAMENLEALAAGTALPNMLTNTWWFCLAQLGGSGGIIGLAFCMLLFAKSERYKALGKLAILPAICSISEPIVFGLPLVLNVLMLAPMLLSPLCCFGLSYLATSIGIIPYLNGIQLSTGTPVILSGFLAGGIRVAIWQVVLICVQFAIYFPFFRIVDKQALEAEESAKEA